MDEHGLETLLAVALAAALAPIIAAALPKSRVPQVVILILFGILIGPHGLGFADTGSIPLLSNIGLGFLFLLAGYELQAPAAAAAARPPGHLRLGNERSALDRGGGRPGRRGPGP
jgi:Kef-type K+ transport system membrane component KefB